MNRRETAIWGLAIGGSLLLHLALFVRAGSSFGVNAPPARPPSRVTHLSFRSVSPPPPVAAKPRALPKLPAKRPPVSKARSKPKPKPQPKPVMKARPLPVPAPKTKAERAPAATVSRAAAPNVSQAVEPKGPAVGNAATQGPQLLERAQQAYLSQLLAHIEAHKRYPRAARRQRIEGRVHVVFRLLERGDVERLQTTGARHLLRQAAAQAVRDALPLPPPPSTVRLPMRISFVMVFALR